MSNNRYLGGLAICCCAGLLGLWIASCFQSENVYYQGDFNGIPEIVDGDTVKLSGENIRLEGIDAPEKRQNCRNSADEIYACGVSAIDALTALIGDSPISCTKETRDFFDRVVGTCYLGALDLNGWMVREGHALAYRQYSDKYIEEEEEACEEMWGIWAGEFVAPWEWRRGKRLDDISKEEKTCNR